MQPDVALHFGSKPFRDGLDTFSVIDRNSSVRYTRHSLWLAATWLLVLIPPLIAQDTEPGEVRNEVFVGSEIEDYLRVLQVGGVAPLYPWSIRSFSPPEVDRLLPDDAAHPWADRYRLAPDTMGGFQWDWVRPQTEVIFNSAFPYGSNNGAVWAGRGLTTAVRAGFSARYGPLSLTVAPVVFRAANTSFELMPNGRSGRLAFADGRNPTTIDLPQRFGDEPYTRLDPGQSTLRLDLPFVTAGISTANQHWGPASEFPILLGNNAAGYPHGFLGTSAPVNLWIGSVHGRLVWGRLDQSPYAPTGADDDLRFMSGLIGAFSPRGIPGLEIGGARFFHTPWPRNGLTVDHFLKPVEGFLKEDLPDQRPGPDPKSDADNQLASAFFRWVFPGSGFELYGEYGREDHNWDLRDFLLEPDHDSAYLLGFQKAWRRSPRDFVVLRGELVNSRISHLVRVRPQAPFYRHSRARQGHTHRGQLLGSPAVYGGGGSLLAADWYYPDGRWTVAWRRELRWGHDAVGAAGGAGAESAGSDVIHALSAEALVFHGQFDLTAGVTGAYNLNRYFGSDAFNLKAEVGVRMEM